MSGPVTTVGADIEQPVHGVVDRRHQPFEQVVEGDAAHPGEFGLDVVGAVPPDSRPLADPGSRRGVVDRAALRQLGDEQRPAGAVRCDRHDTYRRRPVRGIRDPETNDPGVGPRVRPRPRRAPAGTPKTAVYLAPRHNSNVRPED